MCRPAVGWTVWGTCGGWLSPQWRTIMGLGNKVSRRAGGGTLLVACGGSLCSKKDAHYACPGKALIMGRGDKSSQ